MDKDAVQKTKRRLFGFALPDLSLFGDGNNDPELEMLETTISTVARGHGSDWTLTTPEGGVRLISKALTSHSIITGVV